MVFTVTASFFLIFTTFYALFSAAIIYHLRQYIVPGNRIVGIVINIFVFLSLLFWLFALYFLFAIYRTG